LPLFAPLELQPAGSTDFWSKSIFGLSNAGHELNIGRSGGWRDIEGLNELAENRTFRSNFRMTDASI
jgi:hypothetical protein